MEPKKITLVEFKRAIDKIINEEWEDYLSGYKSDQDNPVFHQNDVYDPDWDLDWEEDVYYALETNYNLTRSDAQAMVDAIERRYNALSIAWFDNFSAEETAKHIWDLATPKNESTQRKVRKLIKEIGPRIVDKKLENEVSNLQLLIASTQRKRKEAFEQWKQSKDSSLIQTMKQYDGMLKNFEAELDVKINKLLGTMPADDMSDDFEMESKNPKLKKIIEKKIK